MMFILPTLLLHPLTPFLFFLPPFFSSQTGKGKGQGKRMGDPPTQSLVQFSPPHDSIPAVNVGGKEPRRLATNMPRNMKERRLTLVGRIGEDIMTEISSSSFIIMMTIITILIIVKA